MTTEQSGPPEALVRALVDGPSLISEIQWPDEVDSTNSLAATVAERGAAEIVVVGAERQTAGRGRLGREWSAPPGRSLTFSLLVRPPVSADERPLLPLLAGLALAEVVAGYCPEVEVGLKWPNDLLVDGRKTAGILVEAGAGDAVIIGIGINVDWRGIERWDELAEAGSLAEATTMPVDRWRVLAAFLGVFGQRYEAFREMPGAFLEGYRARCLTIGREVRVERVADEPLIGVATGIDATGALELRSADGVVHRVTAGDVHHVR